MEVGTPTNSRVYEFSNEAGDYILTGYNSSGVETGTLELSIYDGGDMQDGGGQDGRIFKITTVTTYANMTGWILNEDYQLECYAMSREGEFRNFTTTEGTLTANAKTFMMHVGDSYRLVFNMSDTRFAEGYMRSFNHGATVTAAVVNAMTAIPKRTSDYTITVPREATLYVGWKWGALPQNSGGTHYVPFVEEAPPDPIIEGVKTQYIFSTLGVHCTALYRVSQPG